MSPSIRRIIRDSRVVEVDFLGRRIGIGQRPFVARQICRPAIKIKRGDENSTCGEEVTHGEGVKKNESFYVE